MQICVKGNKRQLLEHNFTKKMSFGKNGLSKSKVCLEGHCNQKQQDK